MKSKSILGLAILISLFANNLMADVVIIYPSDDTYVNSNLPNDNFGSSNTIYVGEGIRRSYLKFNLSSIPSDKTIVSTRLRLDTNFSTLTYPEIGAHYLLADAWDETTITWNNAPTGFNPTATDTVTIVIDESFWTVTDDVDDTYRGDGVYSVVMKLSNEASSTAAGFWSSEIGIPDFYPYLEVNYSDQKYSGGNGSEEHPYKIATAADMNAIGANPEDWDKHFILMEDIDLSYYDGQEARPVFNVIGYRYLYDRDPITWPFSGVFDGNDHKIRKFTILSYYANGAAIFRYMDGADSEIRDIVLIDTNVDYAGNDDCGALVGRLENGTVINCAIEGGTISGGDYTGGIVGDNWGLIKHCFTTCNVSGDIHVGGLVGRNEGKISSSCATGGVSGTTLVGGLVGRHAKTISDCYASGSVTGDYAGGLVGQNWTGVINKSYALGYVSGGPIKGGLVGEAILGGETNNSFWNYETTGQLTSDGGTVKSTEEMMNESTFTNEGWDFVGETTNGPNDIWKICDGTNYPKLAWQILLPGDFVCPDGVEMNDYAVLADQWQRDALASDVAPHGGDGVVNFMDWAFLANGWPDTIDSNSVAVFADQWLQPSAYCADIAPAPDGDGTVDWLDLKELADNWLEGTEP